MKITVIDFETANHSRASVTNKKTAERICDVVL